MLSELEYLYCEPGGNLSSLSSTNSRSFRGGSGTVGFARTAAWNLRLLEKSGRPLVWARRSRSFTFDQAAGRPGNRPPIVSSRDNTPLLTSDSAVAPLKALAMLAMRI